MKQMSIKLKELRESRGLTQDELSRATGVHRVTIAKYETTDTNMGIENATKFADALGCTVDELLGRNKSDD